MIIIYISIAVAALGMLLLFKLFTLIRSARNPNNLGKYRSKDAGVSDLLTYSALVDDGVIVGKNGSLMAAWSYTGADISGSTDAQRESVSYHINKAFNNIGSGWMIHVDVARLPALGYSSEDLSYFPNEITAAIDAERRELFNRLGTLYEAQFVITLTWLPPLLAERKFIEMMFDDDTVSKNSKAKTLHLLDLFNRECANFESRLSAGLSLKRLKKTVVISESGEEQSFDDFLSWIQFCVTGMKHPVRIPNTPIYLDALLGGQELKTGVWSRIGRHFIQVVAIEGFPSQGYPGILNSLSEMPIEYRWSSRFIFLDRHEAIANLESYRKKWKQKVRGFFDQLFNIHSGIVDEDALGMVNESSSSIADINSGQVGQGYYTSVIILMDENLDRVIESARNLQSAIQTLGGFIARVETINTMDAYLGSLPGHGVENIRRPLINTMNLADLLPVNTIWTGENKAPCPMYPPNAPPLMHCVTSGNSPFRLNIHRRDLGHTKIFGPPGAGKSTLLAMMALQFTRYQNSRIYVFDKGLSMLPACLAAGGRHFRIGEDDLQLAFAPLSFIGTKVQQAWAMEWIDGILGLNGVITTPEQRNLISKAIMNMKETGANTMSDFVTTVQDATIREALTQYTVGGLMGYLLDAHEDNLDIEQFMVFEIEKLMGMGDKYCLPVLFYLFNRIEESLDGSPTLIMLDEAWLMLGHPVFREKIREWLKTLRKKNCAVVMATQNLSDADNSGILDVIVESTATSIYLANPHARQPEASKVYAKNGLNERQIELIASAVPKRDYYYVSEHDSRMFNLALGDLALAFVGNTDMDSLTEIQVLYKKYGSSWVYHWLDKKGINSYSVEAA